MIKDEKICIFQFFSICIYFRIYNFFYYFILITYCRHLHSKLIINLMNFIFKVNLNVLIESFIIFSLNFIEKYFNSSTF